jgi:hypothetical protein
MSKICKAAIAVVGLLAAAPLTAEAAIYRFEAISSSYGDLGYLDYNSSVFDGTSFQFVANTNLLDLKFTDPISLAVVTTVGPPTDSTIFDSTGVLPTVVGGSGFTGGTDFPNGVWIADTYYVEITGHSFSDVTWNTTVLSGVPEASTWAMMLLGFAGLGFAGYRGQRKSLISA